MEKKPKIAVSLKINAELAAKLKAATSGLYAPTMTAIIERGIDLALRELESRK